MSQQSQPTENNGSIGNANFGTLGRNTSSDSGSGDTGMPAMMEEMAKTLARRRAAVEKQQPDQNVKKLSFLLIIIVIFRY